MNESRNLTCKDNPECWKNITGYVDSSVLPMEGFLGVDNTNWWSPNFPSITTVKVDGWKSFAGMVSVTIPKFSDFGKSTITLPKPTEKGPIYFLVFTQIISNGAPPKPVAYVSDLLPGHFEIDSPGSFTVRVHAPYPIYDNATVDVMYHCLW